MGLRESPETYYVEHTISDSDMVEYQLLKSLAHKILASHRSGQFGLIRERERILAQLKDVLEPNERK